MNDRSPFDIPAANECSTCLGRGYPPDTAQTGKMTETGYVTVNQGYGCLKCLGTGRLVDDQ